MPTRPRCRPRRATIPLLLPAYFLYCTILFGNYVLQSQIFQTQVCSAVARGRAGRGLRIPAALRSRDPSQDVS